MRSIYDNVDVGGFAAILASSAGVIQTGPAYDTKGYSTGALRLGITAVGGSANVIATRGTVAAIIEESTDGSTAWTTATSVDGSTIGTTVAAIGSVSDESVRIEGLNLNRKRFLRVKLTTGFGPIATAAAIFTVAALIEVGRGYQKPPTTNYSAT